MSELAEKHFNMLSSIQKNDLKNREKKSPIDLKTRTPRGELHETLKHAKKKMRNIMRVQVRRVKY